MAIKLWLDKPSGKIDPKLFSEQAEAWAEKFGKDHEDSRGKLANRRTQLRKFYDEVQRLSSDAKRSPESWDLILPRVHMLTAKAAYAKGRNLVSLKFLNFIKDAVNEINDPKDLSIFADLFEATMGFYAIYGPAK